MMQLPRRYAEATAAMRDALAIVMLDGRVLETPAKQVLHLPTFALAAAIAAEWNAQGKDERKQVDPRTMPLTQLAMTAQDHLALRHDAVVTALLGFLDTELIAHYGDTPELVAAQRTEWQGLHGWLRQTYGVTLPQVIGIMPNRQPVAAGQLPDYLQALDAFRLTALSQAAELTGSLAIALALVAGRLDATQATAAAEVESDFQARTWGADADTLARRDAFESELQTVTRFLSLLA